MSATISQPEYQGLFAALRRFASGPDRTVFYLPGNHDAEAWWNREIRAELESAGLVHEFALSYGATFETAENPVVYCEHGNQFDSTNTIRDYDDPLDTPLGEHVVTDFLPRLPTGWESEGGISVTSTASSPSRRSPCGLPGGRSTSSSPRSCGGS